MRICQLEGQEEWRNEAFIELVTQYTPLLGRVDYRLSRVYPPEEVTGEVVSTFYELILRYKEEDEDGKCTPGRYFSTYLSRYLYPTAKWKLHKAYREGLVSHSRGSMEHFAARPVREWQPFFKEVRKELGDEIADILYLKFFLRMDQTSIGWICGVTQSRISYYLGEIYEKLRKNSEILNHLLGDEGLE